jgi:hypothetical protein
MITLQEQLEQVSSKIEQLQKQVEQKIEVRDMTDVGKLQREIGDLLLAKWDIIQSLPQQEKPQPTFQRWFFNTEQIEEETGRDKLPLWHGKQFKKFILILLGLWLYIVLNYFYEIYQTLTK